MTPHLKLQTTIEDDRRGSSEVEIDIEVGVNTVLLRVDGYGNNAMEKGPVLALQFYEGELRALVWPDVKNEEPTAISLEGAKENG